MMIRRDSKIDANQPEIVADLRKIGASVKPLHFVGKGFPDIVVGFRGKNYLFEIKTASGKLNDLEQEFFDKWRGQVDQVRCVEDILQIIGAD